MDEIIDKSHDFIWIDHHETAEKLPQWSDTNIKGLRLIKYAACHLAWNYFNKNNKMPHTVKLVADRDMWEFKYCEDTHAFHEFCIQFSVIDKYDILTLNDILSHERYYDKLSTVTKPKLIEKQIVRHHISGVGAGDVARANATKDIQLLTGAVNDKVRSFEDKLLKSALSLVRQAFV